MKFLLDFQIKHSEFLDLNEESRGDIKEFIIHRFFKHELVKKKPNLLEKRNTFLQDDELNKIEELSTAKNSASKPVFPNLKKIKTTNFIFDDNQLNLPKISENPVNILYLNQDEVKKNIIPFLENQSLTKENYLGEHCLSTESGFYKFKIPEISVNDIYSENFDFEELQEFLRKREILSIVCRRKQQRERRGKRNDEKTKKIFKRIMKSLLKKFKKNLMKDRKKITSNEAEDKFYSAYFGDINEDLRLFHDPLKKKFNNPKFKSISNDYLAQLKKSELFVKDLETFCREKMIVQGFDRYSESILARFSENRKFLRTLDKAKSKFEWVRFELKVAVMHFLFTFQNAVQKSR